MHTTAAAPPVPSRCARGRRLRRTTLVVAVVALVAAGLTGCIATPGDTTQIQLVSTTTTGGWKYDYYRNTAYHCAISGYQTFVIGTKVGSDAKATGPLWVKMHGGGVGFFDANGNPRPNAANKTEESATALGNRLDDGLSTAVTSGPEGWRFLAVSMCSHDVYAGTNTPDANNPNTNADGSPVTTNGLLATKAAIAFTMSRYPTDDYFLHGGSAGSAGSFNVAWGMQVQGQAPTGVVADSGVLNQSYEQAQIDQHLPCARTAQMAAIVPTRFDADIADPANQPDLIVADGRLTVPIMHVWDHGDPNVCGYTSISCPLRNGTTVTMGSADCAHEPLRAAIAAQGPTSRSFNLALCVDDPSKVGDCDTHVPTGSGTRVNTDPAFPADYNAVIVAWVHQRRADD